MALKQQLPTLEDTAAMKFCFELVPVRAGQEGYLWRVVGVMVWIFVPTNTSNETVETFDTPGWQVQRPFILDHFAVTVKLGTDKEAFFSSMSTVQVLPCTFTSFTLKRQVILLPASRSILRPIKSAWRTGSGIRTRDKNAVTWTACDIETLCPTETKMGLIVPIPDLL